MEHPSHNRTTHLVAAVGGTLVCIGILSLIIASWGSFTPTGRIITAVAPLVLLYVLTYAAQRQRDSQEIARYTLLTASIILPFVLGVVLYQSGVYKEVDASLVTLLALLSAANSGVIEFLRRDKAHTPLTLISLLVAAISLISWLSLDMSGALLVLFVTGLIMLLLAFIQSSDDSAEPMAWHATGIVLMMVSAIILPLTLSFDFDPEFRETMIPIGYLGTAAVSFAAAVAYSRLWQKQKQVRTFHEIRTLTEHGAPLCLVVPATLVSLGSENTGPFLTLLLASAVSILISTKVRVSWFRTLGITGIVVALIRLILFGLQQLAAAWPILLLTLGILLIVGAIYGPRLIGTRFKTLVVLPETSWAGLGEPFKAMAPKPKDEPNQAVNWLWLILIFVVLYALSTF